MLPHHQQSIDNAAAHFSADPEVRALLVGGSLAHGYARPDSDVDLMVLLTPQAHARRAAAGELLYLDCERATYPGGYLDGKYIDVPFLEQVAARGSEAARYAYQDARIVFNHEAGLPALLARVTRYPVEKKESNIRRFLAQMNAWRWMAAEARKHDNRYLLLRATSNFVLFCCRVVLAQSERLYPFHKWMLREVERAAARPPELMAQLDRVLADPSAEHFDQLFAAVKAATPVTFDESTWGAWFQRESELNWVDHEPPVADL